jgi:hypothetical protein
MVKKQFFWSGVTAVILLSLAAGIFQVSGAYRQATASAEAAVLAAVPAKISYQGMLTEGGSPVNGSRNMVFKLFTTTDCSGPALATITKNNVPVEKGLFHVVLDINPAHFNGQALRLRVEVGATALGCEEVLPTPYTLFSASTGSLHARPVSNAAPAANQILKWNGAEWAPAADNSHSHFAASWSGSNASYGLIVQNTGSGDGIRPLANTSQGNIWAAVYAYNSGTSPGIYASTGFGGTYSGYFPQSIFVGGSCVGCAMVYTAQNNGSEALQVGEMVVVSGLTTPLQGTSMPLMQVQAVDSSNAFATIGVIQSRGVLEISEKDGEWLESVNMAPGAAEVGEYVFVVVQGMAQVRVDREQEQVQPGDLLVVGQNGRIQTANAEPGLVEVGRVLDNVDPQTDLVWVLVGLR